MRMRKYVRFMFKCKRNIECTSNDSRSNGKHSVNVIVSVSVVVWACGSVWTRAALARLYVYTYARA